MVSDERLFGLYEGPLRIDEVVCLRGELDDDGRVGAVELTRQVQESGEKCKGREREGPGGGRGGEIGEW